MTHESMNLLCTAKLLIFYNIVVYQLYLAPSTGSYGLHASLCLGKPSISVAKRIT